MKTLVSSDSGPILGYNLDRHIGSHGPRRDQFELTLRDEASGEEFEYPHRYWFHYLEPVNTNTSTSLVLNSIDPDGLKPGKYAVISFKGIILGDHIDVKANWKFEITED